MLDYKDIIIRSYALHQSGREIAKELGVSKSGINEFLGAHRTFIAASTQNPFTEGHSIIPLHYQNEFKYSLDVYANILVLCPNCHRLFHYGDLDKSDRIMLLNKLYDQRQQRLENSGIEVSRNIFLELALKKHKETKPRY